MKRRMKGIVLIAMCTLIIGTLSACKNETKEESANAANSELTDTTANTADQKADGSDTKDMAQAKENLSGSIKMAGSTSMEKLANAAAEAFMSKNTGVTISPEFIGSSAGIEALMAKTVDIGNASRSLSDSEKTAGVIENIVAIDGIAVVTHKKNTIANLTKEQLIDIYSGKITDWSEVGGEKQPIIVIGRESGSGTRDAFEEILEIKDKCKYANELNSTGAVMAKVAATPGSIGYVSLDVVDDTVITVSLEGKEPTEANIKSGEYFLNRPFVMATLGEISAQSPLVQAFFEFMYSEEGSGIIKGAGLIVPDR